MTTLLRISSISILLLLVGTLFAQQQNTGSDGLALQGYDPVSYFNSAKPAKGNKTNAVKYSNSVYYFATPANRDEFKKSPEKYIPAYGGWCAYAMGQKGEKVEVNPLTYKIKNGKLLLFYNAYFNNTLTDWNKDENTLYPKAEANWKKLNNK